MGISFTIFFYLKVYCMFHKNRLIEAILMSTLGWGGGVGWCDGPGKTSSVGASY